MLFELGRIRALCRDDRPRDLARAKEQVDGIVRFIEGRRKEVQIELDGPAPEWTYEERWNPPARTPGPSPPPMLVEGSFSALIAETIAWPTNAVDFWKEGSATLQYTADAKPKAPFTRFGTRVMLNVGDKELTNIRIVMLDRTGERRWNLGFRFDPYRAHSASP